MNFGNIILTYRKKLNITQDALAQRLGVTNQAVSKWEADQCCPDIALLPKLADIFGITMDELFGRTPESKQRVNGLPWPDDRNLRVVLYVGHELVGSAKAAEGISFTYEGPALNVESAVSIHCGNVEGNVDAGTDVRCGNVAGDVDAGCSVECGNVEGDVDAGTDVTCGDVGGDVDAGVSVQCGNVAGDVDAGVSVQCSSVGGDVDGVTVTVIPHK